MKLNKDIPLLIDFDGVICIGKKAAEDAGEFFKFISDKKIAVFASDNTRDGIYKKDAISL